MKNRILKELYQFGIASEEDATAMIAFWDRDLLCRYANQAYLDWFGEKQETLIGKIHLAQLLGTLYQRNLPYIKSVLNGQMQVFNLDLLSKDGNKWDAIASYLPAFVKDVVVGFYVHVENAETRSEMLALNNKFSPVQLHYNEHEKPLKNVESVLRACLLSSFPGIETLAKQNFISASKLKKEFKARFNKGVFSYYRYLQMELADVYIKERKYSKKQVAGLFGFVNPSNFLVCYQKYLKEQADLQISEEITKINDDRYKTFITQVPFALAMLDTNLIFRAVSKKYIDDHHLEGKRLISAGLYDVFPQTEPKLRKLHRAALNGKISSGEDLFFARENGSSIWLRWDFRPWRTAEGKIGGILIFTEDITAYRLKEDENHKILEILNKANAIVRIGVWKKNFKNNTGIWNQVTRDILEVPDDYQPTSELALDFYKKGKSYNLVKKAIREAIELGKAFDLQAEIVTAKGNQKWVRVVGYSEFRNNKCERLFGIIQEIDVPV